MKLRSLSVAAASLAIIALAAKYRFESPPRTPADAQANASAAIRTPAEYRRAPDNTFLTFPEWYLVYSPREYAAFIVDRPPSQFPYLGHVGQFWQGYRAISRVTNDPDRVNRDYHLMIWIIGVSTTVEYGLKEFYETVVGRVAEASRGAELTGEDRLASDVAHEYVAFLDTEPWYKFDFIAPLKRLWTETPWWGDHPVRQWERRYFLTSEYLAKAAYGWAIKQANESSYGVESPVTVVVLDRLPPATSDDIKVLATFPDGTALVQLPRYQAFTPAAAALAKAGVNFLEIAGNTGPIMVSVVVNDERELSGVDVVFAQPIMTEPGKKRIAFTVSVAHLSEALRRLDDPRIQLEHIYDF